MNYFIKIELTPESFGKKKLYFWCILQATEKNVSNCGHGWSTSIIQACKDAEEYYHRFFPDK